MGDIRPARGKYWLRSPFHPMKIAKMVRWKLSACDAGSRGHNFDSCRGGVTTTRWEKLKESSSRRPRIHYLCGVEVRQTIAFVVFRNCHDAGLAIFFAA